MNLDPLHDWKEWELDLHDKPQLISELTGGRVNKHYIIDIDGNRFVLRRNNPGSLSLGIDRKQEKVILDALNQAGLHPEVVYCSLAQELLISEYLEGYHWNITTLEKPDTLTLLIETMKKIHALCIDLPAFDYVQHGENYWNRLAKLGATPSHALCERREFYLEKANNLHESHSLCHHDPNPLNIIEASGKLYFLDWEYAGRGWPAFDFAALSYEWNVEQKVMCKLSGADSNQLYDARFMYTYLCELWSIIHSS